MRVTSREVTFPGLHDTRIHDSGDNAVSFFGLFTALRLFVERACSI